MVTSAIAIAVAAAAGGSVALTKARGDLERECAKRQLSLARSVGNAISKDLLADDVVAIRNSLDDVIGSESDVKYAFVVGLRGEPVAHTFEGEPTAELLEANALGARQNRHVQLLQTEEGLIQDFAYRPFPGMGAEIHLGFDKTAEERAFASNVRIVAVICFIFFLVTAGLIHVFASTIIQPLQRLTSAIMSASPYDSPVAVDINTNDEVGRLAEAFNDMQQRLHEEFAKVEKARAAYGNLARKVLAAQEQERAWVAAEVHDSLLQHMIAIQYWIQGLDGEGQTADAGAMQRLRRLSQLLDSAVGHGRNLISNLRPPLLDVLGLRAALREHVFGECRGADVRCDFAADELPALDSALEIGIYRVTQEAVTNALKHARPELVRVELSLANDALHVSVTDDGIGFDVPAKMKGLGSSSHLGLQSMIERTETLGGTIEIKSRPQEGTSIEAVFPLAIEPEAVEQSDASEDGGERRG